MHIILFLYTVCNLFTERKAHRLYRMIIPWIGTGLLVANDEKWFRSRRLLTPAFHFGVLKPYVQVYNECVQTLIVSVFCIIICIEYQETLYCVEWYSEQPQCSFMHANFVLSSLNRTI